MAAPFVEAARAAGCSHARIILRHVVPNCLATYIVLFTTNISYAIVVEASLTFLGVGGAPRRAVVGRHAHGGHAGLETAPWMFFFPGLAISLAVFALNLLGDAIRDLTDPRLRGGLGNRRAPKCRNGGALDDEITRIVQSSSSSPC